MNFEDIYIEIDISIDNKYRKFSQSLMPGIDDVLGVRLPVLRKIAKTICKDSGWNNYIDKGRETYFEDVMLKGMVIGYCKAPIDEVILLIGNYIPKITNWSLCDSFCTGLKIVNDYRDLMFRYLDRYVYSFSEYECRFALVMYIDYFISEEYLDDIFDRIINVKCMDYYALMAKAWLLSMCYIYDADRTIGFINNNKLDEFTYKKTIQKIKESKVSDLTKLKYIKDL